MQGRIPLGGQGLAPALALLTGGRRVPRSAAEVIDELQALSPLEYALWVRRAEGQYDLLVDREPAA
jgi:hypothetical protein